jgi:hypothetical protein
VGFIEVRDLNFRLYYTLTAMVEGLAKANERLKADKKRKIVPLFYPNCQKILK